MSAVLTIPSVEVRVEIAVCAANTPSYRMVVRMGYRRDDHLELVNSVNASHGLPFERFDTCNGMIKLRSEKADDVDRLMEIAKSLKTAVICDLADSRIGVMQTLRPI